jgi:hypothetical protein
MLKVIYRFSSHGVLMKRFPLAVLAIGTVAAATCGIIFKSVPELERVFQKRGISGTFVMFDTAANTMLVWNEERAKQRFAPAETFRMQMPSSVWTSALLRALTILCPMR